MNQLFKNIFIRWDKKFDKARLSIDSMADAEKISKKFEESSVSLLMSEVLVFKPDDNGQLNEKVLEIDLNTEELNDAIKRLRDEKSDLSKFLNYHHPIVYIDQVKNESGCMLNSTLSFKWGGDPNNAINIDLGLTQIPHFQPTVNRI